jgi:hypothetical protein
MISHGSHGYNRSTPFWGRNSDDVFLTASTEILQVDLAVESIKVINNAGSLITGKTNENSGIIFMGQVNNELGYHLFDFSSRSIEKIMSIQVNQGIIMHISGNNIFYNLFPNSAPNPPCTGYCTPFPGPYILGTFYHLDKQTQQITNLENKKFKLFSPDGSTAILSHQIENRIYVFDYASKTILDSTNLDYAPSYGLFFRNGELHSFDVDVFNNLTIKKLTTGQILQTYKSEHIALEGFQTSKDGTKIYYSGGMLNGNSLKILLYDIATNTEKVIADVPFLPGGGSPFSYFVLSDDNKKMLVQSENDLYVKVLE